jgi:hypothetical protein
MARQALGGGDGECWYRCGYGEERSQKVKGSCLEHSLCKALSPHLMQARHLHSSGDHVDIWSKAAQRGKKYFNSRSCSRMQLFLGLKGLVLGLDSARALKCIKECS